MEAGPSPSPHLRATIVYYTVDDDAVLPEDGILCENGSIIPKEGAITLRAVAVSGDLVSDPISVSYTFYYPRRPRLNAIWRPIPTKPCARSASVPET